MAVLGGGPAMLMEVTFPAVSAVPLPRCIIRRQVPGSLPDRDRNLIFPVRSEREIRIYPLFFAGGVVVRRPDYPGGAPRPRTNLAHGSFSGWCPSDFRACLWFTPMRSVTVRNSARTLLAPIVESPLQSRAVTCVGSAWP